MYRLIWWTVAIASFAGGKEMTELEALGSKPSYCTYEYAYDMYGAHCGGLRLSDIPDLSKSIEILEFSDNKLREITGETFSSYTSIKFLYLAENQIYFIEDNAFSALSSLSSLDLSKNVIMQLPPSIFQLSSLRKLYLSGNPLFRLSSTYLTEPVKAPLDHLDISDCKIKELPDWGILPQLIVYNISYNPLTTLGIKHFPSMCSLKNVDLTNSIDKIDVCVLSPAIWWLQEKRISFKLKDYTKLNSKEFHSCPGLSEDLNKVLNVTFQQCKGSYSEVSYTLQPSQSKWIKIIGGLIGFLVGFVLLLYLVHRFNVFQIKRSNLAKTQSLPQDSDKQASAILLNNASP